MTISRGAKESGKSGSRQMCNEAVITQLTEALAHAIVGRLWLDFCIAELAVETV